MQLLAKAHVEHFVRLVEHHGFQPAGIERAPLDVIAQPSGRSHDDMRPAPECIAALSGRDPNWISQDWMRALRRSLGGVDLEILPGEREGEWIGIDRGSEVPGTIVADLYRLEDEVHVYERCVFMQFDRITAAAYQLLHVFLHELGHHVDAMARPFPGRSVRGEDYAEQWANRCADRIWDEALAMLRR